MINASLVPELGNFTLPDHARVWVFQSDRFLSEEEIDILTANGKKFAGQWHAHGKGLTAEFGVIAGLFVVMSIDEEKEGASGCSIDTFMRFVLEAEKQLGLNLTNRLCVAYETDSGIIGIDGKEALKAKVANGTFAADSLVYDNLAKTLGDLRHSWTKPASATWLASLFK